MPAGSSLTHVHPANSVHWPIGHSSGWRSPAQQMARRPIPRIGRARDSPLSDWPFTHHGRLVIHLHVRVANGRLAIPPMYRRNLDPEAGVVVEWGCR